MTDWSIVSEAPLVGAGASPPSGAPKLNTGTPPPPAMAPAAAPPATPAANPWTVVSETPAPAGSIPTMTVKPDAAQPPKESGGFLSSITPDKGTLKSVGEGLMTPVLGAAQLANHLLPISDTLGKFGAPTKSNAQMDAELKQREEELHSEDKGKINWARMAGEIASPINWAGAGMSELYGLGKLATATLGAMYSAAMQPTTGDKGFAREKIDQMAAGAVGGAASVPVGNALGAIAQPVSDQARQLMQAGVRLTPGQIMGGVVRRAEEASRSIPFLGQAIQHGEDISNKDFNRAVYDEVLAPIGERYRGPEVGNAGIAAVRRTISAAYDRVLPYVRFRADRDLANDFHGLQRLVSEMPPDQVRQYQNIATNRVWQRLQPTGTMDGGTFKQVESELTTLAEPMHKDRDAAQRQLGTAIDELNNMLRRNLARQNPEQQADIEAANAAWYRFAKIRQAASNRVTSDGEFSPVDLLQAIRRQDFSVGKGRFAEGALPMQRLAQAGSDVIRPKLPNSGTQDRRLWTRAVESAGLGAGAYGASVQPEAAALAAAGIAGSAIPYSGPAMSALRAATMYTDPAREAANQALRSPWVGPLVGAVAGNEVQ